MKLEESVNMGDASLTPAQSRQSWSGKEEEVCEGQVCGGSW